MKFAAAIPIPEGKTDKVRELSKTLLGPRAEEYNDIQKRAGVSEERYWIQSSPDGDMMVFVSDGDQTRFGEILANPQTEFDRWLRDQFESILEIDAVAAFTAPPPEFLGEYRAT
jgi:hypothetical protein